MSTDGSSSQHTLEELLALDLVGGRQVILELRLPPLGDDVIFRTMKVSKGKERFKSVNIWHSLGSRSHSPQ